jgi:hypothetical protein
LRNYFPKPTVAHSPHPRSPCVLFLSKRSTEEPENSNGSTGPPTGAKAPHLLLSSHASTGGGAAPRRSPVRIPASLFRCVIFSASLLSPPPLTHPAARSRFPAAYASPLLSSSARSRQTPRLAGAAAHGHPAPGNGVPSMPSSAPICSGDRWPVVANHRPLAG